MPLTTPTHGRNSFNGPLYHHNPGPNMNRRGSDMATVGRSASSGSATVATTRHQPLTTLEDIAAEIQLRLSTSPSADFGYLDDQLYAESSGPGSRSLARFRSRSLPNNFNRNQLKSNLSPKTPLRKAKSVRFADTQGLPLVEAVHQLTHKDSSYTANKIVPYDDDDDILSGQPLIATAPESKAKSTPGPKPVGPSKTIPVPLTLPAKKPNSSQKNFWRQDSPTKQLTHKHTFMFTQPSLEPDFFERVRRDTVVLESIREEPRSLHGIVRVFNLAYNKEVVIRWTHDSWRTSHDTCCVFCSNDGETDRFAFELPINGDDVSFAIRYRVESGEFWDNNRGANYTVTSRLL